VTAPAGTVAEKPPSVATVPSARVEEVAVPCRRVELEQSAVPNTNSRITAVSRMAPVPEARAPTATARKILQASDTAADARAGGALRAAGTREKQQQQQQQQQQGANVRNSIAGDLFAQGQANSEEQHRCGPSDLLASTLGPRVSAPASTQVPSCQLLFEMKGRQRPQQHQQQQPQQHDRETIQKQEQKGHSSQEKSAQRAALQLPQQSQPQHQHQEAGDLHASQHMRFNQQFPLQLMSHQQRKMLQQEWHPKAVLPHLCGSLGESRQKQLFQPVSYPIPQRQVPTTRPQALALKRTASRLLASKRPMSKLLQHSQARPVRVRRGFIYRADLEMVGFTPACPGCDSYKLQSKKKEHSDECRARVLLEMRRLNLPGLKRMLDAERRISEKQSIKRARHDGLGHSRHDGMLEQRSLLQPARTSQPPQTSQPTQMSHARPPQSCLIVSSSHHQASKVSGV